MYNDVLLFFDFCCCSSSSAALWSWVWGCHVQADCSNFVFKLSNFCYCGNRGWSEINFICIVTFANPEQHKIPHTSSWTILFLCTLYTLT